MLEKANNAETGTQRVHADHFIVLSCVEFSAGKAISELPLFCAHCGQFNSFVTLH
jgi:hypothetical protein